MLRWCPAGEAAKTRRLYTVPNGTRVWIESFFGANVSGGGDAAAAVDMPVAYRVDQDAGSTIEPHFHAADEFQLVVAGEGRIGRTQAPALTLHFAGRHSPYGPIVAGPRGIGYLTLRNGWDPGAHWMREHAGSLKAMPDRRHRAHYATLGAPADAAALAALPGVHGEPLWPPQADGLAAWRHRLPAGARFVGPDPAGGAGQYWVASAGDWRSRAGAHRRGAVLFLGADEPPLEAVAGEGGAELVVMQFPRRDGVIDGGPAAAA